MPMDLDAAVARTRNDRLDDDGTRWTDEETVRHLRYALSDVAHEYIDAGGDRLRDDTGDVTSSSAGVVDLSSYDPAQIRSVQVKYGNRFFPIHPAKIRERQILDEVVRTYRVEYDITPEIGTAEFNADGSFGGGALGGNPLVTTDGTTQLTTWDAFEDFVCLRAAHSMALKDGDRVLLDALYKEEQRKVVNVIKRDPTPKTGRMPARVEHLTRLLRWYYDPGSDSIQICRRLVV